jgi:3-oxosteroid 1-dehydrogenase
LLDTRVKSLVWTGQRVTGLVVERDGAEVELSARQGVLLNSGGFARNLEMRQRYQPQPASVDWTNANPGDTGEMIEAAMAIGAAIALTDQAWWTPISLMPDGTRALHPVDMSKPHCIMVDSSGRRYVNESGSYMEIGTAMYERHKTCPAVPSWLVLDSRHRQWYPWGAHLPGRTPDEWLTKGYMIRAETLGDLARQCSMDAATLHATVERFNGFARSGKDEDFGRGIGAYDRFYGDPSVKPNPNLGAISEPPFYAVRTFPGDVGTGGGLLTDEYARVLRADGTPIEGLYATGNCTATIWGRCYPGPGVSIGGSMVFGYIAARHATA